MKESEKKDFKGQEGVRRHGFLNASFLLILLCILAINFIFYHQLKKFVDTNNEIIHSYKTLQSTNSILLNLHAAESKTHAYIITADKKVLKEIDKNKDSTYAAFNDTKELTKNDAKQQENLSQLSPLIQSRLAQLDNVIQLRDQKKLAQDPTVSFLIKQNEANEANIEKKLQSIINSENTQLVENNKVAFHKINLLYFILIAVSFINIVLFSIILCILNIQLKRQIKSHLDKKRSENLLNGIIDGAQDGIAACDLSFNLIALNQAFIDEFRQLYGRHISLGMNLKDLLPHLPAEQKKWVELWQKALNGEEYTILIELGDPNMHLNPYEISFSGIYDSHDKLIGASFIAKNANKRIEEEHAVKRAKDELEQAYGDLKENEHKLRMLNQMNTTLQSANTLEEALLIICNFLERLLPYFSGTIYLRDPNDHALEFKAGWCNTESQQKIVTPDHCWGLRQGSVYIYHGAKSGLSCPHLQDQKEVNPSMCLPLFAHNENVGLLCIVIKPEFRDMSHLATLLDDHILLVSNISAQLATFFSNMQLHESLKIRSIKDQLTGLYNRFYLNDALDRDIQRAKRHHMSLALVLMDIDHFKEINDTYGHGTGDYVLSTLSEILTKEVRHTDMLFRYGGEEFIIVLYGIDVINVYKEIEKLRSKINSSTFYFENKIIQPITVSFGIAMFPEHGADKDKLIQAADKALYYSKNTGRNKVTVYRHEL